MASSAPSPTSQRTVGILQGVSAYLMWGLLPLYFLTLPQISAFEFVGARVVFSLVLCAVLLAATSQLKDFFALFRDGATTGRLAIASVLIAANWVLYAVAVLTGHVLEASLGYFINPIVAMLLGVVILKERLTKLQWTALGFAGTAVLVLTVALGSIPWISLGLAFSFGFYGLVKNQVGQKGSALVTLSMETLLLSPFALAFILYLAARGESATLGSSAGGFWLLAASGVITAVPLLLFGGAARRLPLSTVGSLQFLAPLLQFLLGLLVFGEHMPPERWAGFILVWIAVALIMIDLFRAPRVVRGAEPKKLV
ncbi:EamA family transporter RarD [Glutamicibacter sp. PS]|uniref:EamA family transporter RarD n=1 Tax=Glutamicibacter sp. PS TaxID=3075634 RepID=UPI00283C43C4|nr:EamA family transporter RarD [Glutamicibacter sp. PS]MDR4532150.1 EamA family transporter RarD [Glutamicibacter sp. PS]